MAVNIAGIEFAHHEYDEHADVLYLDVAGYEGNAADSFAMPEGHGLEFDDRGRVLAMTLVNVKYLLDRGGELTITWPVKHVQADEVARAFTTA